MPMADAGAQVGTALPKLVILDVLLPKLSFFGLPADWMSFMIVLHPH